LDIRLALTEADIRACFPVMHELRPHLEEALFVAQVQRQQKNHDYQLLYVVEQGQVAAAAGFRVAEFLAWGKTFYLDDLITASTARKHGYGGHLLDWLLEKAVELGCRQFHLDSGMQRHDAHRLYLNKKLNITSHHFAKVLS
jgi:GNAT superfamily N-acetyltransferase